MASPSTRSRPSSPSRPISSSHNISRPSSAFLDSHARLAWGGPWGVYRPSAGLTVSTPRVEKMPLSMNGTLPMVNVKVPKWGSCSASPGTPAMAMAIRVHEAPHLGDRQLSSQGGVRSLRPSLSHGSVISGLHPSVSHGRPGSRGDDGRPRSRGDDGRPRSRGSVFGQTGRPSFLHGGSSSSLAFAKSWSSPAAASSSTSDPSHPKLSTEVVSSEFQFKEECKRKRLLLKDFINNRLEDDQNLDVNQGLNDLCLFHCQAARAKYDKTHRRKKPPVEEKRRKKHAEDDGASGHRMGRRGSQGCAAASEVQRLCGILKQDNKDHDRHMHDIQEGRTRRPSHAGFEAARRHVENQFRETMREKQSFDHQEELVVIFGSLIVFLLEEFGSLHNAMEEFDHRGKRKLTRVQFEKGLESAGFDEPAGVLGNIFMVLDLDNDNEIGYDDLTSYHA